MVPNTDTYGTPDFKIELLEKRIVNSCSLRSIGYNIINTIYYFIIDTILF